MERSTSLSDPIRNGSLYALGVASCVTMFGSALIVENGAQIAAIGAAALLVFWPLARRGAAHRACDALSVALIPHLFFSLMMALVFLYQRVVRTWGEGYGGAVASFIACAIAFLVAVYVGAELPDVLRRRPQGVRPVLRPEAVLVVLAVVSIAALRREHVAPPIETYVTRLPVLGAIPPITCAQADVEQAFVHAVGSVRVMRRCTAGRVDMTSLVVDHPSQLPASRRATWRGGNDGATVRYDPHTDAVVFESRSAPYAFRRATGETLNLSRGDLAPWHAPPRGWVTSSFIGLLIALGLLAWPRRAPASLVRWRGAIEGTLSHDDTITFADGAPFVRLPKGHGLTPGHVLVLDEQTKAARGESASGSPFRDVTGHAPDAVIQGTQRDVLDAIEAFERGPKALAVMVALTSSTPLLVGALRALVM